MRTTASTGPRTAEANWSPLRGGVLQRCACGKGGPAGECAECRKKRLQPRLRLGAVNDPLEREADRVADAVVAGRGGEAMHAGSLRALRRDEAGGGAAGEAEKYKEAAKKVGEAFLETSVGKEIVDGAKKIGAAFWETLPGKIITGTAAAGAVTTIAATNSELPIQVPEIPLDVVTPGLSVQITYEGPAQQPTKAAIAFTFKEQVKEAPKKSGPTAAEKYRAETARIARDQEAFREGLKSDAQRAQEKKDYWDTYWRMRAADPLNPLNLTGLRPATPGEVKKQDDVPLARKEATARGGGDPAPPVVDRVLARGGTPLDAPTRAFMERRFGHRFDDVRIHTDAQAAASARAVGARAYTVGRDVVFDAGAFAPQTTDGQRLLAHELTHVVQQGDGGARVQRTIGDDLDLTSPRFKGDETLEAVFDGERFLRFGSRGEAVRKVQQALLDAGFPLPKHGADAIFGPETQRTVMDFQRAAGFSADRVDGIVGSQTLSHLDSRFPTADAAGAPDDCTGAVKTVTVDFLRMRGSSGDPAADLAFANDVFRPCCVQFAIGQNVRVADAISNLMLRDEAFADQPSAVPQPGDTDLEMADCGAATTEELRAFGFGTGFFNLSSRFRVMYVASMTPRNRGVSAFPLCATGPRAPLNETAVVMNGADRRTLAHEFGHILMNTFSGHRVVPTNIMHTTSGSVGPATDVAPVQCDIIHERA